MSEREEASRIVNEIKIKLDVAIQNNNSLNEKSRRVGIGGPGYDDLLVQILAYDDLIKKLTQEMSEAQAILDR